MPVKFCDSAENVIVGGSEVKPATLYEPKPCIQLPEPANKLVPEVNDEENEPKGAKPVNEKLIP